SPRRLFPSPPPPEISPLSLHDALPILPFRPATSVSSSAPAPRESERISRSIRGWDDHSTDTRPLASANATQLVVTSSSLRFLSRDRKSTRLNSSHVSISYAVFCLKKKK